MKKTNRPRSALERAKQTIKKQGGIIHTAEAIQAGIHPRTLYQLRDDGTLERLSRGVYRLAGDDPISNIDLVTVAVRAPQAVVCLVSALSFHQITTQIPHSVSIALIKGGESPRLDHPPLSIHRFSSLTFREGIEEHRIDGIVVKVYSPEKTLADCFKFRNKIGMDIVLEALKLYRSQKRVNLADLFRYAKLCRVDKVMRPYLEAIV